MGEGRPHSKVAGSSYPTFLFEPDACQSPPKEASNSFGSHASCHYEGVV